MSRPAHGLMNQNTTSHNVFAGPFTDRAAHMRKDEAWLEETLESPDTRFLPVYRSRNLIALDPPAAVLLERGQLGSCLPDADELIFLGRFRSHECFTFDTVPKEEDAPDYGAGEFRDLRLAGSLLPADEAALVAYAQAMVLWHRRHRHCGTCGHPTRPAQAGHVRKCTNDACARQQFPRVDPAIIVLVFDEDKCLLGRQASWPNGRYSTIAGFVEPGESLEDAVKREVIEETSVNVGSVKYHSSQPWPFPSSLMLGFTARGSSAQRIHLADEELEDARWFTRRQIAEGTPLLSPPLSIAYRLIEYWFDQEPGVRLSEIVNSQPRWR